MKIIIITILFISAIFLSCSNKETPELKQEKSLSGESIKFEMTEFKKSVNNCNPESDSCTYILMNYPLLTSGSIKEKVNGYISLYLKDSIWTQEGYTNNDLNQMAINFFHEQDALKKITAILNMPFQLKVNSDIKYQTVSNITLSINYFIFTGGAHPNEFTKYTVFSKSSGNVLSLNDIFKPGFEDLLNKKIDMAFRKKKGLTESDNLQTKGGLFENKISYNNNFAISEDVIDFFYNNYEIAPYVNGSTELKIPLSELKEILKK